MQDDIFNLLMLILMLENGGGTESINQLVIMYLLMNNGRTPMSNVNRNDNRGCQCDCGRDAGFTF